MYNKLVLNAVRVYDTLGGTMMNRIGTCLASVMVLLGGGRCSSFNGLNEIGIT